MVSSNGVIFPNPYESPPCAMPDGFSIVTVCGCTPIVPAAHPNVPAEDAKEPVAPVKARPDGLTYGSSLRDEITPLPVTVHFDATLRRWPCSGLVAGGERPIGRDAGIEVVVASRRYGKGSSRERSAVAERAAGVRPVIAESFERICRQDADNVGLLTSTDPSRAERLPRGAPAAPARTAARAARPRPGR